MANLSNINNKFLVTTGGNVLIGQTSAVGSSIFQVTGNVTFSNRVSAGESFNSVKDGADTVADGPFFALKNAAGTRQYINQLDASNNIDYWYYNGSTWTQTISLLNDGGATFAGDVTISNSTHSYLNINAAASGASEAGIFLKVGGVIKWETYTANNDGNYNIYSQGQGIKLAITPTGNVGIGTSSPVGKLTVSASEGGKGIEMQVTTGSGLQYILAYNRTAGATGYLNLALASNTFQVQTGASGAQRMFIEDNGVTTIGMTNATGAADVRIGFTGDATGNGTGRLKFVNSNSYKSWQISAGGTPTGALAFTQSGTFGADNFNEERMRITSGGQLLIGKTELDISISDGFRFDPNGEGYASIPSTGANAWHVYDKTNNAYRFYVSGGGQIYATSTSISGLSDITLKENIKPLETGLDDVMKLKPKRFDWKNGDGKNIAGFIAQEVEQVLPDLVSESKYTDEETKKSLKMGDMIPTLVKAIQELKAEIEILKKK